MKLIIDIPDVTYKRIKDGRGFTKDDANILYWKSRYGTPLDDIKADFISQYPKNEYGDIELGGRSCVFSLNKVLEIIDKHIGKEKYEWNW